MEKEFIPYEQALALKELGFDEPCLLCVQYSWGTDVSTGKKFKNSIWLGNGYDADIDDKKIKYKFPKYTEPGYGDLKIPLYQQAFRWFREKYNLFCEIQIDRTTEPKFCFDIFQYEHFGNYEKIEVEEWYLYRTQEEAELECLKELIRIVKQK